jgi:hypothetical protein
MRRRSQPNRPGTDHDNRQLAHRNLLASKLIESMTMNVSIAID